MLFLLLLMLSSFKMVNVGTVVVVVGIVVVVSIVVVGVCGGVSDSVVVVVFISVFCFYQIFIRMRREWPSLRTT